MEKTEECKECRQAIVLGRHRVERFWPNEKTTWTFHKACYESFMAKLDAKRNREFQAELDRVKLRDPKTFYFGRQSV